jgi:hypothetical protein
MTFGFDALDGIQAWPNQGFAVRRGGVGLTVAPAISGMNVSLAVTETISPGDTLEVSYAWYGPGGPTPGPFSGVGGNLVMRGPPSVMVSGKTIDAWAWPFVETIMVP